MVILIHNYLGLYRKSRCVLRTVAILYSALCNCTGLDGQDDMGRSCSKHRGDEIYT
jgi:hypothetical protein